MRNVDVTSKITHGMYVLTTKGGGCIVDAVAQVGKGEKRYHENFIRICLCICCFPCSGNAE